MNKTVQTKNPGISIRLTWAPHTDKETWVRGYPIDSKTGIRIDGITEVKRKADTIGDIEIVQGYVINAIEEKLSPVRTAKRDGISIDDLDLNSPIVQAYKILVDTNKQINEWAPSTQRGAMSYFANNILPEIQHCNTEEDFTMEDYDILKNVLINYSLNNTRSKKNLENADSGAGTHLYQSAVIYAAMQEVNPNLPDLPLLVEGKKMRMQPEQIKSLPISIHRNFRKEVEKIVIDNPELARGVALMDSGGLRPAEAAAVKKDSFSNIENCKVVSVLYQEVNNQRVARLKSDNGYRRVVLDEWGSYIVSKCNESIEETIVDFITNIHGSDISAWVRSALKRSGCDEEYISSAMQILKNSPEYDENGMPDSDVAAYILRRNRASIWKNFCGYTQDEIDYLMGHKKRKKEYRDINTMDPKLLSLWVKKNSRYDICPEISVHPAHNPIRLTHGSEEDLIPFSSYKMKNVSLLPLKVTLNINSVEPGEAIIIRTKGVIGEKSRCSSRKLSKRMTAEIIGFIPDEERGDGDEC